MRISDWSSDVCSSDLPKPYVPAATPPAIRPVAQPYQAPAYVPPPPVAPPAYGNAGTLATATHLLDRPRHDSGSSNAIVPAGTPVRSAEHTSELQSLMRISYAVFCLKKNNANTHKHSTYYPHIRTE